MWTTFTTSFLDKGAGFHSYIESLWRGTKFLVAFIQIAAVHSKFGIELWSEINKR